MRLLVMFFGYFRLVFAFLANNPKTAETEFTY